MGKGDFNGDHTDDLLWQTTAGTLRTYSISNNQIIASNVVETMAADMRVAGMGNYTGDVTDDMVLRNDDGSFELHKIEGSALTQTSNLGQISNEWHVI